MCKRKAKKKAQKLNHRTTKKVIKTKIINTQSPGLSGEYYTSDNAFVEVNGTLVIRDGDLSQEQIWYDKKRSVYVWSEWSLTSHEGYKLIWSNKVDKNLKIIWTRQIATQADLQGQWIASDGATINIHGRHVFRNGVEHPDIEVKGATIRFLNWTLIDKKVEADQSVITWKCRQQTIDWRRLATSSLWIAEVNTETRKKESVGIIEERLPGMGNVQQSVYGSGNTTIGLYKDNELIAATTYTIYPQQDFCEVLFFACKFMRQGHGSFLMKGLKDRVSVQAIHHIVLSSCNLSVGFFEALGFEQYNDYHLSSQMIVPRLLQVVNATLMVYDLARDPEYITPRQLEIVDNTPTGTKATVKVGNISRTEKKIEGWVRDKAGAKLKIEFNGTWAPEWVPVGSARISLPKSCFKQGTPKRQRYLPVRAVTSHHRRPAFSLPLSNIMNNADVVRDETRSPIRKGQNLSSKLDNVGGRNELDRSNKCTV